MINSRNIEYRRRKRNPGDSFKTCQAIDPPRDRKMNIAIAPFVTGFVLALLAGCSGMQATSTVRQQIDEQERHMPDLREDARLGIDQGQKSIATGQAMVDDGRRMVREGQALINEGNETINEVNRALSGDGPVEVSVQRRLADATAGIREGNALVSKGNKAIADGQKMIRRGREQVERSLEALRAPGS